MLLLAISGGPDSTLLCHILHDLVGDNLQLAHINYEQRGEESEHEMKFVQDLAFAKKLRLHTHRWTEWATEERAGNFQDRARVLRYRWLNSIIDAAPINAVIVTGHNCDDQSETFLMNLARGAGVQGLSGMSVRSGNLFRPLLSVDKADILGILEENSIPSCLDSSNNKDHYLRNRVRHRIMPPLMDEFPKITQQIYHSTQILQLYHQAMNEHIQSVDYPCTVFSHTDRLSLVYDLLHKGLSRDSAFDVLRQLDSETTESKTYPCGEGSILVSRKTVYWHSPTNKDSSQKIILEEGTFNTLNGSIHVVVRESVKALESNQICIPIRYRGHHFHLRYWKPGDRMAPFGMKGKKKKIQDILTDLKLEPIQKKEAIVMEEENTGEILWLLGLRACELTRVRDSESAFVATWNPVEP